ncbi:hypothetical protein JD969_09830 [Planctomycetota bacterium]|nr:hypothetical protein JD969_09830 [Planctomycetota bacterium]
MMFLMLMSLGSWMPFFREMEMKDGVLERLWLLMIAFLGYSVIWMVLRKQYRWVDVGYRWVAIGLIVICWGVSGVVMWSFHKVMMDYVAVSAITGVMSGCVLIGGKDKESKYHF